MMKVQYMALSYLAFVVVDVIPIRQWNVKLV